MTVKGNTIWKHNLVCNSYCNYYGVDYPFEIEYVQNQGQTVTTTRSVEYILECYKYSPNCLDYHHLLDENFDRAIVYNTEQISGDLILNLSPKNNPYLTFLCLIYYILTTVPMYSDFSPAFGSDKVTFQT